MFRLVIAVFTVALLTISAGNPCRLSAQEGVENRPEHQPPNNQASAVPGNIDEAVAEAQNALSREADSLKMPVLIGYCVLIVLGSLIGGHLPSLITLDHNRMQTIISFVGGLMLGIGVFHMLPHALHEVGDPDFVALWMMPMFPAVV